MTETGILKEGNRNLPIFLFFLFAASATDGKALLDQCRTELGGGNYVGAIRDCGLAVTAYRASGDLAGTAAAFTALGLARTYSGDYQGARRDETQAFALAVRLKDPSAQVVARNNLGNVDYYEGRYADALRHYQEASLLVDSSPGQDWTAKRRQLTQANLATLYQRLGQYDRALDIYTAIRSAGTTRLTQAEQAQMLANMGTLWRRLGDPVKALETYRAAQSLYHDQSLRIGEIAVLNNIGIALALDLNQPDRALAVFNEANSLARTTGDRPVLMHSLLYRGETQLRLSHPEPAARDFRAALDLARTLQSREEQWKGLYGLARVEATNGRLAESRELLRDAVGIIESLRAGIAGPRGGYLNDKRLVYDLLIRETASAGGSAAEVFELMEQSRARALRDRNTQPVQPKLANVQGLLPDRAMMLEYWLSNDDAIAIVWATRTRAGLIFRKGLPNLRRDLTALSQSLAGRQADWQSRADTVRRALLDGLPQHAGPLLIVADRELTTVPFDVLTGPDQAVSYLPSALLLKPSTRPPGWTWTWPWARTLVAFADPAPGSTLSAAAQHSFNTTQPRLSGAEAEAREVASILHGRTVVYTGVNAIKERLYRSALAPILHLATHAKADPEDPARSWLLFAPLQGEPRDYDYLFLRELETLDLRGVDLVTASACETDRGRMVEGEGPQSFSRAFLAAGARSVLSTLWKVEDQQTRILVARFYRGLAAGNTASESLRLAKLEFRGQHPFYWAGFTLTGDPELRIVRAPSGLAVGLSALLLLIGVRIAVKMAQVFRRYHRQ